MRVRIQIIVESDPGDTPVVQEVATLERGPLSPEGLGLTLAEARDLLRGVQETMVAHQVAEFVAQQECCPDCGRQRSCKGRHEIVYRTLLLPERTAPELAYLETKFAAPMSYGLTVDLLAEILPLGEDWNTTSVRRQVQRVAERTESELEAEQLESGAFDG